MAHVPLTPRAERWHRDDAVLSFFPGQVPFFANVSRVRTAEGAVPALAAAAASWFGARGRADFTWFLGPSATPAGLQQQLVAAGAQPIATATSMVLDGEPPAAPEVRVEQVTSAEALLEFRVLLEYANGVEGDAEQRRPALAEDNAAAWADMQAAAGTRRGYLAYLDDAPVAAGGLLLGDDGLAILSGGGTRPDVRGRGLYRALVRARWDAARQAGARLLAVQASDQSAPILASLGFEETARLTVLRQAIGA